MASTLARKGPADAANWIGRSEGLLIRFGLESISAPAGRDRARGLHDPARHALRRLLHGDRADHPLAKKAAEAIRRWPSSRSASAGHLGRALETAEKKGFDTGIRAVHPFDPSWTLPVYVANFILMEYGTGAIFGCPAHDQRDLDFRQQIRPAGGARW
jgi:leucyl-tRNA synthetase